MVTIYISVHTVTDALSLIKASLREAAVDLALDAGAVFDVSSLHGEGQGVLSCGLYCISGEAAVKEFPDVVEDCFTEDDENPGVQDGVKCREAESH